MATNKVNGKRYIGQTTRPWPKRQHEHQNSSDGLLSAAIHKHGKDSFTWEILEDGIETEVQLNEREMYWIAMYESTHKEKGYNILKGGGQYQFRTIPTIYCHQNGKAYLTAVEAASDLGLHVGSIRNMINGKTHCTRGYTFEKIDSNKTYPLGLRSMVETSAQIRGHKVYCFQNGIIYDSMHKAADNLRLAEAHIRRFFKGELNSVQGYTFEKVEDISKYPLPLQPMRRLHTGRVIPIVCLNNGIEYFSISEAGRELNLHHELIWRVLHGKLNHTGGFRFVYKSSLEQAS
jgi:group I intron endonuclease